MSTYYSAQLGIALSVVDIEEEKQLGVEEKKQLCLKEGSMPTNGHRSSIAEGSLRQRANLRNDK